MKGARRRADRTWIARATSSLPTPVSPQTRTVTSARAACSMTSFISRVWELTSRASSRSSRSVASSFPVGGAAGARGRDPAWPLRVASTSSTVHGRRTTLSAPAWMASTIGAVMPGSAIMITAPS